MATNPLRALPSVSALLASEPGQQLARDYGHTAAVGALRAALEAARDALRGGEIPPPDAVTLLAAATDALRRATQPTLRPVINATGVIIHTNLGRAPLSDAALDAVRTVGGGYSTLEFDLETGGRGSRNTHPEPLLCELTGAEAALVVNNAAAALVLALSALAAGREGIVSRGQAVEIGGGFRVPDIMQQSGARLVEVGTTNKTRPSDYANAITPQTALLLRVHASNFRLVGFTESVSIREMAAVAHDNGLLLVDDVGSGALLDPAQFGLAPEPLVPDSVAAGAHVVLFSGDKLLGGPQAGIIVGQRDIIERLKRHPLARALRADKLILAALVATLEHYRRGEALERVPVWWMMRRELCDLGRLAKTWSKQFPNADIQKGQSTVGGGSIPGSELPTVLMSLNVPQPDAFLARLRGGKTPVIARIADDKVLFDPRTVFPEQEAALLAAIKAAHNT